MRRYFERHTFRLKACSFQNVFKLNDYIIPQRKWFGQQIKFKILYSLLLGIFYVVFKYYYFPKNIEKTQLSKIDSFYEIRVWESAEHTKRVSTNAWNIILSKRLRFEGKFCDANESKVNSQLSKHCALTTIYWWIFFQHL